jgi:hypothetical protein
MNTTATRRLAAILAADVVGYSRLMGADEEGTQNDCAFQEGATPKRGAVRGPMWLLRTLAFRVGRRVRISFAPARSLSLR